MDFSNIPLCDDIILEIGSHLNHYDYRNLIISLDFFIAKNIYLKRKYDETLTIVASANQTYLSVENLFNSRYGKLFFTIEGISQDEVQRATNPSFPVENVSVRMDFRIAQSYFKFVIQAIDDKSEILEFPSFWFVSHLGMMMICQLSNGDQINKIYLQKLVESNKSIKSGRMIDDLFRFDLMDKFVSNNQDTLSDIDFYKRPIYSPYLGRLEITDYVFRISLDTFGKIYNLLEKRDRNRLKKDINFYLKSKNSSKRTKITNSFVTKLSELRTLVS